MSNASAIIKLCKDKKLPNEIEDLIFEFADDYKKNKIYLHVDEGYHIFFNFYNNCYVSFNNDFTEKIRDFMLIKIADFLKKDTKFYNKFYLNEEERYEVENYENMNAIDDFDDAGQFSKENWAQINMAYLVMYM